MSDRDDSLEKINQEVKLKPKYYDLIFGQENLEDFQIILQRRVDQFSWMNVL